MTAMVDRWRALGQPQPAGRGTPQSVRPGTRCGIPATTRQAHAIDLPMRVAGGSYSRSLVAGHHPDSVASPAGASRSAWFAEQFRSARRSRRRDDAQSPSRVDLAASDDLAVLSAPRCVAFDLGGQASIIASAVIASSRRGRARHPAHQDQVTTRVRNESTRHAKGTRSVPETVDFHRRGRRIVGLAAEAIGARDLLTMLSFPLR